MRGSPFLVFEVKLKAWKRNGMASEFLQDLIHSTQFILSLMDVEVEIQPEYRFF